MLSLRQWLIVGLFLIIVWGSLLVLLYLKADETTKDPCNVCAKRMGDNWVCYSEKMKVTFLPNGTIETNKKELIEEFWKEQDANESSKINLSAFNDLKK